MKRNELVKVTEYLQRFKKISSASRVEDNIIKIVFDNRENLFFDMKKGDSYIFYKEEYKRAKIYNAPFDVILHKRCSGSHVKSFEVASGNRILRITLETNSSYKSEITILQFEFTGRNTNCIILDENAIVLEALRHIDSSVSYRSVKVGEVLQELPIREFAEEEVEFGEDIKVHLQKEYEKRAFSRLLGLKNQKLINVQKNLDKFYALLKNLDKEEDLEARAVQLNANATLILSNLYQIKPYQQSVKVFDFEGKEVCIELPKESKSPSEAANTLFTHSKKLKRKAKSLHVERKNIEEKIDFLEKLKGMIEHCKDEAELGILVPKSKQTKKEKKTQNAYESFFIDGFKVMLGKNERGNIELLREAKKSDIWMHLKDIPSTHVIIRTDKQSIPMSILEFGAKLCVDFSVSQKGSYFVDYTQRRNVKIVDGANVNYIEYKTISVNKEL